MSLRSKVIGTLLSVFLLYVFAAWLVLATTHTPAFDKLEHSNASAQLRRVYEFLETERSDVDLLVTDWAEWDETLLFIRGENDEYYDENLSGGYIAELGMSFGALFDPKGQLVWGQAFDDEGDATELGYLFPNGLPTDSILFSPTSYENHVSGLFDTAQGLAVISSAAVLRSSGEGPVGGYMIAGKLLNNPRMTTIGQTLLSDIDLLPLEAHLLEPEYQQALEELTQNEAPYAMVENNGYLHTLKLLTDVEGQNIKMLRVRNEANITSLGARTIQITILMLLVAALVLTLTLWFVLKGMLLLPIEHLTTILRGQVRIEGNDVGEEMLSTVRRLTESRGLISQRNDEIGELLNAFDELSSSLQEATTSVWRIAHLDGLTGLANRRLLIERLSTSMANASHDLRVAVLFIDLDDFKRVNDQLGHEAGDQLLVEVAARIQAVVGNSKLSIVPEDESTENIVARIGGDEFVVSLTTEDLVDNAHEIAAGIVDAVSASYVIDGHECIIGACVGLAVYPEDANHLNGILAYADAAMYEAKRSGKNTWRRFVPELLRSAHRKSA